MIYVQTHLTMHMAKKHRLRVRQEVSIWVNQAFRPATVLAVVGRYALLEYVMPRGSTTLRLVHADNPERLIRRVSYHRVPLVFLRAMQEAGMNWIGKPQSGQPADLVGACLKQRTRSMRISGMLPLPWGEAGLSLSPEPDEAEENDDGPK